LSRSLLAPPFVEQFEEDFPVKGGNVLGRWSRVLSDSSAMSLQVYYDRTERNMKLLGENRDTFDLDFQHSFALGSRQAIVWGLNARSTRDAIVNSFNASMDPAKHTTNIVGAFLQDEITLARDRLRLTVGSKFEHNEYSGLEPQPTIRMAWTPNHRNALWGAFSHADRIPSRAEEDVRVNIAVIPAPDGTLYYVSLFGNRGFKSEHVKAYEAGYRIRPVDKLLVRIAAFYNVYDKASAVVNGTPFFESDPAPGHVVIPIQVANGAKAKTHGVEVGADWSPMRQWKLAGGYTWFKINRQAVSSAQPLSSSFSIDSPTNEFFIRSLLNLSSKLECDATAYYVGKLPLLSVPHYLRVDLRVGWRPTESLEFSAAGQDLFDGRHAEFGGPLFGFGGFRTEVERRVYGKVTWRF
jgi:iron complex outermembrane receptor protein